MTKKENMNFVERVLAFIKVDDDSAVKATQKEALKRWKKQVSNADKAIKKVNEVYEEDLEELKEYLIEAQEELDNSYLNIDVEQVKTVDNRKDYVANEYEQQIANAQDKVLKLEEDIKALGETKDKELEKFEKIKTVYSNNIKRLS